MSSRDTSRAQLLHIIEHVQRTDLPANRAGIFALRLAHRSGRRSRIVVRKHTFDASPSHQAGTIMRAGFATQRHAQYSAGW